MHSVRSCAQALESLGIALRRAVVFRAIFLYYIFEREAVFMFRRVSKTLSAALAVCLISTSFAVIQPIEASAADTKPDFSYITGAYENGVEKLSGEKAQELASDIYDQLKQHPAMINIKKGYYDKSKANAGAVASIFYEVSQNTDAGLLVNNAEGYHTYTSSDGTMRIEPTYFSLDDPDATYAELSAELDEILEPVQDDWTNAEKALYLHDYIATNFDYDHTYAKHNVYEFFQEGHEGVCDAYASLYSNLLNRLGIRVAKIISDPDNHAWNAVDIGGTWYYVDITHDDSYHYGHPGMLSRDFFLNARQEHIAQREAHKKNYSNPSTWSESDWTTYCGMTIDMIGIPDSGDYSGFWSGTETAILPYQGNWIYTEYTNNNYGGTESLKLYDRSTGTSSTLTSASCWWPYVGNFGIAAVANDVIFYTTVNDIYGYYNGKSVKIATDTSSIYGMKISASGDQLLYYTANTPTSTSTEHALDLAECVNKVRPQVTVTFMCNGSVYTTATIDSGSTVAQIADPTAEHYRFDGWYTDENFTTPFSFSTAVNSNTTVYAKMVSTIVDITVNDDGTTTTTQAEIGDTLTAPTAAGKDKYLFAGWYTDSEFANKADFTAPVTGAMDLYARYITFSVDTAQVTLSDNIKLTYHITADKEFMENNALVKFFVDGSQAAEYNFDSSTSVGSNTYEFVIEVAARQMDSVITGEITVPGCDGTLTVPDYTVNKNLEDLAKDPSSSSDEVKNMIGSTSAYGAYANVYFDNGSPSAIDEDTQAQINDTKIEETTAGEFTSAKSNDIDGLEYVGSTLLLKSSTTVRHYFTIDDMSKKDDYTFEISGDGTSDYTLTVGVKDRMTNVIYVDVAGIDPAKLGSKFTVTVKKGAATQQISYSPCCYMYSMYKKYGTDTEQASFIGLLKAMFRYYEAALAYTGK